MSDVETRLARGLAGAAELSPHPGDLAASSRERLRRRRRTTSAVVAAALAVITIPVGLTVTGPGDSARPDRDQTAGEPVPADWRAETWRDLTLWVPPEWDWGAGTDWCAHDESAATATPVVSRPDRPVRTLGCAPSWNYGVHFFAPSGGELPPGTEGAVQQYRGRRYPYGAWLGYASTGAAAVWVVTDSRQLTRRVLDSTEVVADVDPNGCPVQVTAAVAPFADSRVSVCHYDTGLLEQSELLSTQDSRSAVEAVRSARSSRGTDPACPPTSFEQPVTTLLSASIEARLLPAATCRVSNVFLDAGQQKLVTEDVLYWAFSPGSWWGALGDALPVPDRLRTG